MRNQSDLSVLASEMKAAQDNALYVELFTERIPGFDMATGYEIAQIIHRKRLAEGSTVIGRKIGFTNPDMWASYGVGEPIWAHIYDDTVEFLLETQGECELYRFVEPKIEPEIVIQFIKTPGPGTGVAGLLNAIGWVAHGFEIVQSHFKGWKFQAADTVADWALHGRLLVGPRRALHELGRDPIFALESFMLTLSCNGKVIETGKGSNVLGSPLAAVEHLLEVLESQANAMPLQAGEIVTTGTITAAHSVHAGEVWSSSVRGIALPGLAVSFPE